MQGVERPDLSSSGAGPDLARRIREACAHIDRLDPGVQALVPEPNREARLLREAGDLASRSTGADDPPGLFGMLVGVKDIFRVDGFPTRAGSQLPPEIFEGPEAACVTTLRRAGALILGKTHTTEFAYFEPGPTRNPHHLDHTPGGSSSGSAAAVAAGYCPLALGTQTVGSVIRPAAFCGVVGFKPTFGRISTGGVIPFAPSLDHVGLFAGDVATVWSAASVLCENWLPEAATPDGVLEIIGVPEGPYLEQASAEALACFEEQVRRLERAGYQIRRIRLLEDVTEINARHTRIQAGEMARVHAEWFTRHEPLYRPRTVALIRTGQQIREAQIEADRAGRKRLREEIEAAMEAHGIDLWVCPAAAGPAPPGLDSTGDPALNLPWTHAGVPAITLPAGTASNGLPVGLQCVTGSMADEHLLAWATRLEAILGFHSAGI